MTVKQFGVQELSLGEPVVGVAARLEIDGKATLGPPSEGLDLSLTSKRLDAPGEFKAAMTYVPATDKLSVAVNSDEPAGGVFAHWPSSWPATGEARLQRRRRARQFRRQTRFRRRAGCLGAGRRRGPAPKRRTETHARPQLPARRDAPSIVRPVFAGETTLKGDLFFDDDSTIATPGLHLVSADARLDIVGGRSADDVVGLKIHAGAIPGATQIGKLDLNASIVGPVLSPFTEGAFDAGDIHVDQGSLDHISASFRAVPNGPLNKELTRIAFEGQGAVSGLALADAALARAVGSQAKLALSGTATAGGDVSFDTLSLTSPDLEARYSGLLTPKKVHGRLALEARDLNRFAPLAGGVLKGEARGTADLDGAPSYGALTATIDAQATHLSTAYPMLDRITGGDLHLTGAARSTTGGGFGFTNLLASGAHGSAKLNGEFGREKVSLEASVDVPQASVFDPRVSGKAEIVAALTGTPEDLNAALKASLGEGRLLDRKTSGLSLEANAAHITGQLEATASASGDIDGHQLQGSAHVAKTPTEGGALTISRSISPRRGSTASSRSARIGWLMATSTSAPLTSTICHRSCL